MDRENPALYAALGLLGASGVCLLVGLVLVVVSLMRRKRGASLYSGLVLLALGGIGLTYLGTM